MKPIWRITENLNLTNPSIALLTFNYNHIDTVEQTFIAFTVSAELVVTEEWCLLGCYAVWLL
jgi:hypothetical protein